MVVEKEVIYAVLAQEHVRHDTIAFFVLASYADQARKRVEQYYAVQGWDISSLGFMGVKRARLTPEKPVQFLGHAYETYQETEALLIDASKRLLAMARSYETETGFIDQLDDVRKFLSGFAIGQQVLEDEQKEG